MNDFPSRTIDRYREKINEQLPRALSLFSLQQIGDPAFFSNNLKYKDALQEFRYMLMVITYKSSYEAVLEFWQTLETQSRRFSLETFRELKREVLVNVALAKVLDKLSVKFWWAQAEDNDVYHLTFWFIGRSFAYAVASGNNLEILSAEPRATLSKGEQPRDLQSIANRFQTKGYYFTIPDSLYDGITGEPSSKLISEVAQLNLPTLEEWDDEIKN